MFERGDIVFSDRYGYAEVVLISNKKVVIEIVRNGKSKQVEVKESEIFLITKARARMDLIS